jgi:intein/homing endonuclease/superfamily II DNA or RNA helicase
MPSFVGIPSIYPKLLELRKSTTAEFKPIRFMRPETKLRYYQVVGALHMILLERMVLGDATGIGKCVSEDTYIQTGRGLIKIGSLLPRDNYEEDTFYDLPDTKVLSVEGEQFAGALYYSGRKTGIRITTRKGFELLGLGHHPILSPVGNGLEYKRLDAMVVGDYVCINRKGLFPTEYQLLNTPKTSPIAKKYRIPQLLKEDLAELLGYYVSEGHSSCSRSFIITQVEPEIHNQIRFLLKNIFGYEQNDTGRAEYAEVVVVHSIQVRDLFEEIGVAVDERSGGQIIPELILRSPKTVIQSFLRAYFEGDGGVENGTHGVSCCSKSKELIIQIQILLLGFGIVSTRKKRMIKVAGTRKPYWRLYFFGKDVDIFAREIGFLSERKCGELLAITGLARNTNLDIIPFGGTLLKQSMSDIIQHLRTLPEQHGFSTKGSGWKGLVGYKYKHVVESYMYGKRDLTYEGLGKFISTVDRLELSQYISNMPVLRDTLEKNIFFDRVDKLEPAESRFFDFHVPETHNFTGNGFINHNTLQTIATYSFLLERDPSLKLLIVCQKSALYQWAEEFDKFTEGITVRVLEDKFNKLKGYQARKAQYELFKENVLITNYNPLLDEYESIKDILAPNYMVIFDECHAFKSRKSKTHYACKFIADAGQRVYGLSATIIKNGLEEVYGIYDVVVPGLFGRITKFQSTYCVQEMMKLRIGGKDRKIPKTVGYKNLPQFKAAIDPYFLIRRKEEVATELPKLISRKVVLEMLPEQKELYRQAVAGIIYEEKVKQEYYEICDKIRNGDREEKTVKQFEALKEKYEKFLTPEGKKRGKLAALTYCQMISNGPALVRRPGESSKEEEFLRLMTEELVTEKVILYTRFKTGIPTLEIICERNHIKYTMITGEQDNSERTKARISFQTDPTCNLIFITSAGSASLNLQAASVIIFYDTPWSYGDLVQTIGRAQRIGSLQEHVLVIHMVNRGTIDVRVMNRVSSKKLLSDEVLGDTAQGALDFTSHEDSAIDDLYSDLLKDAEEL